MNYIELINRYKPGETDLPQFLHICYHNLRFDGIPNDRQILNLKCLINNNPKPFIRHIKKFKKARRFDYNIGFEINQALLKTLLDEIESIFIKHQYEKTVLALRREVSNNRKVIFQTIVERDGRKCNYCGSVTNLEIDHIYPVSKGGNNNLSNLQLLCRSCNIQKGNSL